MVEKTLETNADWEREHEIQNEQADTPQQQFPVSIVELGVARRTNRVRKLGGGGT